MLRQSMALELGPVEAQPDRAVAMIAATTTAVLRVQVQRQRPLSLTTCTGQGEFFMLCFPSFMQ